VHALPHIFLCHLATVNPYGPQLFQPKPLPPDGGHGLYDLCSVPKAYCPQGLLFGAVDLHPEVTFAKTTGHEERSDRVLPFGDGYLGVRKT
jgi:hypothetical protein